MLKWRGRAINHVHYLRRTELCKGRAVNMEITPASVVVGSVYTASKVVALTCYSKVAFFERQNKMVIEPSLLVSTEYLKDSMRILLDIEAANNAAVDTDVLNAQNAIDRIKFITDNDGL